MSDFLYIFSLHNCKIVDFCKIGHPHNAQYISEQPIIYIEKKHYIYIY